MHNYKELKVWEKAVNLVVDVYKTTAGLPPDERFGLTSQIRRCSVSIGSNIAEGAGRNTKGEFNQFLGIAYGSICELETQLIIAEKLNFIKKNELEKVGIEIIEIQKMIYNLKKSL